MITPFLPQLVREIAQHSLRIQKTLEDANIKLDCVITDILGVSGRAMIEALTAFVQDPPTGLTAEDIRRDGFGPDAWFDGFLAERHATDLTAETFAQAWHSAKRFKDLADGSGALTFVRRLRP